MNAGDKAALVKAAQKAYDSLRAGFMAADVLSMSGISLEKLVQALLSGGGFNSHKFVDLEISDKLAAFMQQRAMGYLTAEATDSAALAVNTVRT